MMSLIISAAVREGYKHPSPAASSHEIYPSQDSLCLKTWRNDAQHAQISRDFLPVPFKLENIIIS